ncbi:GAF domain-containing protein [Roseiarcus sp.]|uniref:GAF domain-containing protein n=1 Tax=Roseiarcus sp. TaxID=1969460 RepID=UPI003F95E927
MPARRTAPSSPPPPTRARSPSEEPTRDALLEALAERERELAEAREQQAAVAQVLQAINASSGDLAAAFDLILEKAVRFCDATGGGLWLVEGDMARVVGSSRSALPRPFLDYVFRAPLPVTDILGRSGRGRPFVHIDDLRATRAYQERAPYVVACVELGDMRTALLAPLFEDGAVVGIFTLIRDHVRPFTDKQIALVQAFAAQAAIAIQNARLFNETQEALERQTATAEVLKVIASSPSDVRPVFDAIAASANRLLGGFSTTVIRFVGEALHLVAFTPTNAVADEALQAAFPRPIADFPPFVLVRGGDTQQFIDTEAESGVPPVIKELARLRRYRSMLFTPLMSSDGAIGMISVTRRESGAFAADDVQLLRTFADQAVIAIQNASLFNETQQALEQQKASADVLGAISKSVADTAPVFEAILDACQRLFGSEEIGIYTIGYDDMVRPAAWRGPRRQEALRDVTPVGESVTGRIIRERRTHHIPNLAAEPDLSPTVRERAERLGSASLLYAPMLSEDRGLGSILVVRSPPKPFSEREQALLQSFADQAAIAIQNVRLFNETKEALERQTATANVLKVISRSVSDAAPVFETILESCQRLVGLEAVAVYLVEGDMVRGVAQRGWPVGDWGKDAMPLAGSSTGLAIAERRAVHFPDLADKPDLPDRFKVMLREAGGMSVLYAPMLWEDRGVGSIVVSRKPAKPFSEKEIALVQSFADQAAIAIQNARMFRETQEALAQQTATADVLKVISRSAFDLQAVLDTLTASATKLCDGDRAAIFQRRGDLYHFVSNYGFSDEMEAFARANPLPSGSSGGITRAGRDRMSIHIPDVLADPEYTQSGYQRRGDYRTLLSTPLMRAGEPIGGFVITRKAVRPFNDRQIELLQTFADQAVIAIENVRLFDEVRARTHDLTEALQQQTATAEVLKVISRSAFDLNLATTAILEAAARLCRAPMATLHLRDGDVCRLDAQFGLPEPFERQARENPIPVRYPLHSRRTARAGDVAHFSDAWTDPDYLYEATARLGGYRAIVVIPLMREGELVGIFSLGRPEPEPFTESQIKLTQTFADQAAIAIENARLFNEVKARTRDLSEALQQQTATADVLKAISRTAFDLDTVLETLISSAVRLCDAKYGQIFRRHGDVYRYAASQMDVDSAYREHEQRAEIRPGRGTLVGRVALENRAVDIADAWSDPEYAEKDQARIGNVRAMLGVPLMRSGEPIGAFALARSAPVPFTQRQVELVQSFADQAVIAIENVRLFDEVQARTRDLTEALQMQTATADVLKVISRSAFDLQAVFNTLTASAVDLCGAFSGSICVRDGDVYQYRGNAGPGLSVAMSQYLAEHPATPGRGSIVGRVLLLGRVEEIPDVLEDADYVVPLGAHGQVSRALLGVPLLGKDGIEGALVLTRKEPGHFTPRQIEIVQTFADQAVIAIGNARLFDEVQARTRDLTEALQMQTATSDVLKVISRSAFDLQAVFNTLVSSAVELGGALTGTICVRDGDVFRYRDTIGAEHTSALAQYLRDHPATPGRSTIAGRVLLSGKVERIPDCLADPEYVVPMGSLASNVRSLLGVPLLRKEGVEGAIILTRDEPGHFSDRQVEIVQTFADQAVIALENVRLFDEVQARTKELAASLDDLRRAQDRLIQSEKLASLGQLTAGIAHEIKNPLNFVNNFSALSRELMDELRGVLEKAPLDEADRDEVSELIGTIDANLDKVIGHGKRADSIVKNMLLHSREGSGERTSVSVNAMVEEALNLAYHGARAEKPGFNVTIAKSLDENAGAAELYAQEMTRVLLNLISNGFYATTKRKQGEGNSPYEPTITASTRDLGDSVEITIRDNGTGIPDEVKAKMFNPFFTTKPAGEGTGLGLSLSHDIVVKQHGGTIDVITEPGAFTQFTLVLPRAGAAA